MLSGPDKQQETTTATPCLHHRSNTNIGQDVDIHCLWWISRDDFRRNPFIHKVWRETGLAKQQTHTSLYINLNSTLTVKNFFNKTEAIFKWLAEDMAVKHGWQLLYHHDQQPWSPLLPYKAKLLSDRMTNRLAPSQTSFFSHLTGSV